MRRSVVLLLALLALSGCATTAHPINATTFVFAMGIDRVKGGRFEVSVEGPNPATSSAAKAPAGDAGPSSLRRQAVDRSITRALQTIQRALPNKIDLSTLEALIISKECARSGIAPILSELQTVPTFHTLTWVLISDQSASDIVNFRPEQHYGTVSKDIENALRYTAKGTPALLTMPFWKMCRDVTNRIKDTYAPLIGQEGDTLVFKGAALFSGDRLTGSLDADETALLKLITDGRTGQAISTGNAAGQAMSLTLSRARVSLRLRLSPTPTLDLDVDGQVHGTTEMAYGSTLLARREALGLGSRTLNDTIVQEYHALQAARSDAWGIGARLRATNPALWARLGRHRITALPLRVRVRLTWDATAPL